MLTQQRYCAQAAPCLHHLADSMAYPCSHRAAGFRATLRLLLPVVEAPKR